MSLGCRTHPQKAKLWVAMPELAGGPGRVSYDRLVPISAGFADENDRKFFGHLTSEEQAWRVNLLHDIVRRHEWKDVPVA